MKYSHGTHRHGPYFEGWYLKCQTKDGKALALIPALHIDTAGQRSASLQVISHKGSWWLEYPETEFHAFEKTFQIRMGETGFTDQAALLHVQREGFSLQGALRFGPFTPLKSDIMGPFRFLPKMECSHGVISMRHTLDGIVTLNGESLDFTGGIGYVETDRGRSFPGTYLWTQCVWQGPECGSLMLSIATIPLPLGSFTGCICAVLYKGKEYRLATYRGVQIEQWSSRGAVIRQGKYRLEVQVIKNHGQALRAPAHGAMSRTIHESLCATVRYRFWVGRDLLFDHTDDCASFEYAHTRCAMIHQ